VSGSEGSRFKEYSGASINRTRQTARVLAQQRELPEFEIPLVDLTREKPESGHSRCIGTIAKRHATCPRNYVAMSTNHSVDNTAMSMFL